MATMLPALLSKPHIQIVALLTKHLQHQGGYDAEHFSSASPLTVSLKPLTCQIAYTLHSAQQLMGSIQHCGEAAALLGRMDSCACPMRSSLTAAGGTAASHSLLLSSCQRWQACQGGASDMSMPDNNFLCRSGSSQWQQWMSCSMRSWSR